MRAKIFCLCVFLKVFTAVHAEKWQQPFFEASVDERVEKVSDKWTTEGTFGEVEIHFDENVGVGFVLGKLLLTDSSQPKTSSSEFEVVKNNGEYELKNLKEFDYEKPDEQETEFSITTVENVIVTFKIFIRNINDEPLRIGKIEICSIPENILDVKPPCLFTLYDEDGLSDRLELNSFDPEYAAIFKFTCQGTCTGKKVGTVAISPINKLDYEDVTRYLFDWTVKDELHEDSARVQVTVVDMPDELPTWSDITPSIQFEEESEQTFKFKAIDGDSGVNDDISYSCEDLPRQLTDLMTCKTEGDSIKIDVKPIDRDKENLSILTFTVVACEVTLPDQCIREKITFLIIDINDNVPKITITPMTPIVMEENKYVSIDLDIKIEDLDLSTFGTFDVFLKCKDAPDVEKAMQVIPNTGYREGTFALSIINATILDYDRKEELREFEIQIVTVEKEDPTHTCTETLQIELLNWNDEEPFFKKDSYDVLDVSELFGREGVDTLDIPDLIAVDSDFGDYVTYALIGSGINNILELESERVPKIRSKSNSGVQQLFDFEKQEVVRFQVEASDNFSPPGGIKHKKFAEISIHLKDVNDETPFVTLSKSSLKINENCEDGYELPDLEVTATDDDKDAKLTVEIDWTNSFATQYGQTKKEFVDEYKGSFELIPKIVEKQKATFSIRVVDVVPKNTPDFEKFDTIYLRISVKDENQKYGEPTNQATLVITVVDLNDNKPRFVEEVMDVERKVKENVGMNTTIGIVAAIDDDANSILTFTLSEKSKTPKGLVTVDSLSRVILVAGEIDAEDLFEEHGIKSLAYEICVNDGDFNVCEDMDIFVIDQNDEKPHFTVVPVDKEIKEHSPIDTHVLQIEAFDDDRDAPNNEITYYFDQPETNRYFFIDETTGLITVANDFDRDGVDGRAFFEVTVVLEDNPVNPKEIQTEKSKIFKIILVDINDNPPLIGTKEIKTIENIEVGGVVGTVEADDADEPGSENAKINFEILGLNGCYAGLDDTFFKIETDEEYLSKKGTITALKPLRGLFTECTIQIKTNDFGTDPGPKEDTKDLKLIIDKYNFDPPEFTYPTKKVIYLKPDQPVGQRVKLYDSSELRAVSAKHERENKYQITFSLDSESGKVFSFIEASRTSAYLSLKNGYDKSTSYNVKIYAQDDGEPPLSSTLDIKIGFYDTEKEPVFAEEDREMEVTVTETELGLGESFVLPAASLDVDDESIVGDLDLYYYKYEDLNDAFAVDKLTRKVTLENPIFVLNLTSDVLKVVASRNDFNYPPTVSPESIVTVNLKVKDINDNPPVFNHTQYSSSVMASYEMNRVVLVVAAYDFDEDDTELTFSILYDTYKAEGQNINAKLHKFDLDKYSGEITLGFEVQQNMKGHFIFDVEVTDGGEYPDQANVKIYIISDDNEVAIRFNNTFEDISLRRLEIEQILSDNMGYNCTVHGIIEAPDENGNAIAGVTEVKTHCIDRDTNLPIGKESIKAQMNTLEMIGAFKQNNFILYSVQDFTVPENMEETLKIWLICVSVVLGSFCFLLIVAFIVKTRSLTTRIGKLTTVDFADNEKKPIDSSVHVPAAPNTNRRAVEGSNPVFNINYEDREMNDYDKQSISSGDSDFLGIENNPVFDD